MIFTCLSSLLDFSQESLTAMCQSAPKIAELSIHDRLGFS